MTKSGLQRQRDKINGDIRKKWPSGQPKGQSRGIVNEEIDCYMNTALISFMHQPSFLNWILTHNASGHTPPAVDCGGCAVKNLVNQYWPTTTTPGPVTSSPFTPTRTTRKQAKSKGLTIAPFTPGPVIPAVAFPEAIRTLAIKNGGFVKDSQDDAVNFYGFMQAELKTAIDNDVWRGEHEALFSLEFEENLVCNTCQTKVGSQKQENATVLKVPKTTSTWDEVLNTYFQDPSSEQECKVCKTKTDQTTSRSILAGPKILTFNLDMFYEDADAKKAAKETAAKATGKTTKKIAKKIAKRKLNKRHHNIQGPETLDLTAHQVNVNSPLTYRLSSIISHRETAVGSGHYVVSVRGPGENSNFSCINDENIEKIDLNQFLKSPQRPRGEYNQRADAEVYILTYTKE